ncbi:hypothetical protein GCM10022408_26910 [Hymenobacter fastidiosus]|uniref:Uncharacterized protein n=2 Tax=Hymenobacter fastidiosus TaxID=486264 RepID=A0ABP7SJV8_9BACT
MLAKIEALLLVVFRLSQQVDAWTSEKTASAVTVQAKERQTTLRKGLRWIYLQLKELQESIPASVVETAQQDPKLWLAVENEMDRLLTSDPSLAGMQVMFFKPCATEKEHPQYGYITSPMPALEEPII